RKIVDFVTHCLMLLILATVAWKCIRLKLLKTARHAVYSTLGLFFLVGSSQMLMCHGCLLAGACLPPILHAVLGVLGFLTGGVGIFAKIVDKKRRNKPFEFYEREPHVYSKHSRCGLVGYVLLSTCLLTGVVLLGVKQEILLMWHRILGLFSFGCLASSQYFSYSTGFARREWTWIWIPVLQIVTACATVLVGHGELLHIAQEFEAFLFN
ncbi:hypothetical protein KR038_000554, partial [Drosophila bunnanda]